tara:strand:+ start:2288 stop:4561 length:2274 start_codon:yes stop_codon:yes gene_type:complete
MSINGTKIIAFNDSVMLKDYYEYIISVIKYIVEKHNLNINIILNNNNYTFNNDNKTIKINLNIEHTLVKENGRGLRSNTPVGKIKYDNNKYYYVRVVEIDKLNEGDIVIEYSNPNIYNINSIESYSKLSKKTIYIAPIFYKNNYINLKNRNNDVITTFYNENEPRRAEMINIIKSKNLNYKNINTCFDKDDLQKLYQNTKILINIHQTPHHDTFEEFRCLPALQNGIIVVSEKSPLNHLIPYNDLIIWADYDNIVNKVEEILENYEEYYKQIFSETNIDILNSIDIENKKIMEDKIININMNLELKRYPLHSALPNEKKMDLYIYNLDKNVKIAYLSVAKCASNEIRDIFTTLTGNQERLEINIKNKNDPRIKDLIIFSFIRNPWERFHSAFNMINGKTSLELPNEFLTFTENPDACKKIDPGHWTPQYDQLITEDGEILPKYIGNINNMYNYIVNMINDICIKQNIKEDFINKLNIIKNKKKIHVRNKDFTNTSYYLKYYNKQTYDNVSKYLETDIKLFDFKFDMKHELKNFDITKNIYDIIYIHIPKTGGGTIKNTIKNYIEIHNDENNRCNNHHEKWNHQILDYNNPYYIYIISIRNPIKRFISAFYHMLKVKNIKNFRQDCVNNEITCINTFLDKLFINGYINKEIEEKFIIGHLKFGFYEYLYHFLEEVHYYNIIILLTDNLDEEISRKIHIDKKEIFRGQEHSFKPIDKNITIDEKHIYNLKNYLKKEYLILEKLKKLSLITEDEYNKIKI